MRIGVLALQGAFVEHISKLQKLGVDNIELRQRKDICENLDGLILPGGESTAMRKLLIELDLLEPLKAMIAEGMPVFGTCAGMILLASEIEGSDGHHFGTIPMCVRRNAYGRQLGSFHTDAEVSGIGMVPMTFIRAPYVAHTGDGVEVTAQVDGKIVGVRYKNQLAFSFHPELDDDTRIHEAFLKL